MGDVAAVATTLRKAARTDVGHGNVDSQSLSKIWTDFWLLRSFGFRGLALEGDLAAAGLSINRTFSDVADQRIPHSRRFPDNFKRDGDSLPRADGQTAEGSDCIPSTTPLSQSFSIDGPRSYESGSHPSRFPSSKVVENACADGDVLSAVSDGTDEKSAYQNLLSGLRERYQCILRRRTNYVNLMSFVFFTTFYAAILFHQRRAFLGYDIHKSLTYLLPSDGNGGVVSEFRSIIPVHNWLEALVNETWIDPICGNGVCDLPVEELAYGRFGCQEDCGWRGDLLQVTMNLSYKFATDEIRTSSLWNICREGLCSPSSVDPSSSPPLQKQSCYFLHAGTFTYMEGNVSAAVYLPLSEQWEFCLATPSPVISVAGTIAQVPLSNEDRANRSSERTGYLGDGPFEISVEDLYAMSMGTNTPVGAAGAQSVGQSNTTAVGTSNSVADSTANATTNTTKSVVPLKEWTYSRKQPPCRTDCLAMTACMFRCQDYRDKANAMLGVVLPDFNVPALAELCAVQAGCAAHPELRLPKAVLECTNFGPFLDLLLRGESLVDAGGNATDGTGGVQGSGISIVPGMNATGVAVLAGLISTCHTKLVEQQSAPLQQVPKCSPGCSYLNMGDFKCDLGCLTEECQYDFADCCEEHKHFDGGHHFHCPSNQASSLQMGEQLFRLNFTVPSTMDAKPGSGNDTGDGSSLLPGPSSSVDSRWRMVGVTNRIIAGVIIKQYRTPLQRVPPAKKFRPLFDLEFDTEENARPFGANPRFLSQSSMYVPALVNRTHEYFTPDQLSDQDVPLGFFPLRHRGRAVFPVFIDMSKTQDEALMWVKYLEAGSFLDAATKEVKVEIVTYNGILEYFGLLVVSFRRQQGGVVSITSTVQMFSLDMYNSAKERARGVGEVLLVIMVIAGTVFELQQVVACVVETGSTYQYFSSVANVIDLTSISLFYVCIALWVRFLIKYHGLFNIQLSYQPYRTHFDTDGERLAKMLELAEDGDVMRELLERFEEVQDIARAVNIYSFLTALNLLFLLFRILKLTDFHPRLGIVTHTLARATNDIAHYLLVAGSVFVIFGVMAHLSFGTILAEFSTLPDAFNTCFLMVVGETGINDKLIEMQGLQLAMAWVFFWLFMIIMNLILINFFIAFIIDSFTDHMSSGARSSSTVPHDLHDIFRDAARQAWARLTCQGQRARSDTSIAAKLEALATLTAGTEPTYKEKEKEVEEGGRGIELSGKGQYIRFLFDLEEDPSNGGGGTRVGIRSIKQTPQRQQARSSALEDKAGRADFGSMTIRERHANVDRDYERLHPAENGMEDGHGRVGKGGSGGGTADEPPLESPPARIERESIASRLCSLLLPGARRARAQAEKRLHRGAERRVVINGCPFTEDEIAKLLLDGMQTATLAGGKGVRGANGSRGMKADPAVRAERARARKVLFGSHAAGGSFRRMNKRANRGKDREGVEGRSHSGLTLSTETFGKRCGRVCGGKSGGDEEVDLESSQHGKDVGGLMAVPTAGDPGRGSGTVAACHDMAREISRHAIWRFGMTAADELPKGSAMARASAGADGSGNRFLGPMAAVEPSMPENPTVQVAHMVGGLQAQLVEMESRWNNSMANMEARWTDSITQTEAHWATSMLEVEARWTRLVSQLTKPGDRHLQDTISPTYHGVAPGPAPAGAP